MLKESLYLLSKCRAKVMSSTFINIMIIRATAFKTKICLNILLQKYAVMQREKRLRQNNAPSTPNSILTFFASKTSILPICSAIETNSSNKLNISFITSEEFFDCFESSDAIFRWWWSISKLKQLSPIKIVDVLGSRSNTARINLKPEIGYFKEWLAWNPWFYHCLSIH